MQYPPSGQNWPSQQPPYGSGRPSQSLPSNPQWNPQTPSQPLPPYTQWGQQPYPPQQGQWQQPYGQPPPGPGWQPQQPPKKSRKGLWITLGIVVALIFFGCAAMASIASSASKNNTVTSTSTSQIQTTTAPSTPTTPPTPTPTVASGPAKVGQTITVNDVSCTLLSVKTIPDDGLGLLKAGNEWIVVTVKLVNNSGQDYDYAEFDFNIISGSGNATSPDAPPTTYTANNELDSSGTLTNGGSTTGDIIFQAPVGDHNVELSWKPNFFGGTTDNVWLLGL